MRKQTYGNVKLIELQSMPFHDVLPLIVGLDDAVFWTIIKWLAAGDNRLHPEI